MCNRKTLLIEIQFYLLLIFIVTLPFSININSFIIILLVANTFLIHSSNKFNFQFLKDNYLVYGFGCLFLAYLFAFLLHINANNWLAIERRFSILIFPLIFGGGFLKLQKKQTDILLFVFVLSTFLASAYTFRNNPNLFLKQSMQMEESLIMNRPYFGLYTFFSIVTIIYLGFHYRKVWMRLFLLLLAIYFFYFSYLLFAKMAFLSFSISLAFTIILITANKDRRILNRKMFWAFPLVGFVIIFLGVLFVKNPQTFKGILGFNLTNNEYNINVVASSEIRQMIWSCVFDILTTGNNWFTGVGLSESPELLDKCYLQHFSYHNWFLEQHFNAHNDFLQLTLELGIIGPIILVLILLKSVSIAVRNKDYLYLFFIVFFFFCCLTESMLARQKGIVFFSFFNSLFAFNSKLACLRKWDAQEPKKP